MGCQAQPLEWLDGEIAKSSTLLATLGPNDPLNQMDIHNVWLDAERAIEHAEDCDCKICQTHGETLYEDVLEGGKERQKVHFKHYFEQARDGLTKVGSLRVQQSAPVYFVAALVKRCTLMIVPAMTVMRLIC